MYPFVKHRKYVRNFHFFYYQITYIIHLVGCIKQGKKQKYSGQGEECETTALTIFSLRYRKRCRLCYYLLLSFCF